MIRWNTDDDTFEFGQWFHARIYERRCDLTPNGALLVYFAQKISARSIRDKEYTYAWTAVSKPPYLTALALWPKGDCWNGGGLFESDRSLLLYHIGKVEPHPKHKPARWMHVRVSGCGRGEDDPIFSDRLDRDGWTLKQTWKLENLGHPKWYHTLHPEVRERPNRSSRFAIRLVRRLTRLNYSEEFSLIGSKGGFEHRIEGASWADWDWNGRLVYCRGGKVLATRPDGDALGREELLADFNSAKPEPVVASRLATIW